MKAAQVRFYAELNDFLPPSRQYRAFAEQFWTSPSVKDLIEGAGVPHTEVDLVLVNGESVAFDHRVDDGDRISVYPVFESIDIGPVLRLRPEPLRQPRFVLDVHLGKLARYLRMLGFDAIYANDASDADLARVSAGQHRILLTRDRGLLMRSLVTHGYYVREVGARRQLAEVVRRFDLGGAARPFSRCMRCNSHLETVNREQIADSLPPRVRREHDDFERCAACGKLYWKGSHHRRMRQLVSSVVT